MASPALIELRLALAEIEALERANPSPTGAAPTHPEITRAIGRASVVLASGHLERYVRSLNETACDFINTHVVDITRVPVEIRLLHARQPIDALATQSWERREGKLRDLIRSESWLWNGGIRGPMSHRPLLQWMKSPKPARLIRYFRYWGIDDIFSAITRKARTRREIYLHIDAVVTKRNNIAHGDRGESATQRDVRDYTQAIQKFCERSDRRLAAQLEKIFGAWQPW